MRCKSIMLTALLACCLFVSSPAMAQTPPPAQGGMHGQQAPAAQGGMHGHGDMAGSGDMASMDPDVKAHPSCPLCGMNRGKFAHSRMLLEFEDGSSYGACSLHCAVLEMAVSLDKVPVKILVGDYGTKKLIDAEKAYWVLGGDQTGVMSKRAKWAFADKAAAEAYIKAHGGKLADFDAVIQAAFEDMAADTKMIRERRKMMKAKQAS
ncbi:nitrous oxide reductase accessory protein NosL [Fundidesulfovibrio soli]|uniref:nitrous oxide reductase accessory protein NosL n=1 Tax=Fundidesulfovibrio soli TaxID=2922716 RepID=UPI001FAF642C|nr:nitrous oxide reductase accessory protein NosL [Fundidesulfovibrio soli]